MLSGSILILHYLGLIMQDGKIDMNLTTAFTIFGGVRIISGIVSSLLADRVGHFSLCLTWVQDVLSPSQQHTSTFSRS
ncbi:hypothetical protein evm_008237 [Chilo suppressalis]|nr:hypothetical protein evm_008237 [Chilo suppressalis]